MLSYSYGGWGLYTDEGSSDMLLENNVVYHTTDGGFHQHYGRENRVRNNIFAFSATKGQAIRTKAEDHVSFTFEGNILYDRRTPPLAERWADGNYRLGKNVYWNTDGPPTFPGGLSFAEWQQKGHDADSIVADPDFIDAANFDFRLRSDSPALKLGFQPIDTSSIGLVGERAWTDLPKQIHRAAMVFPK